MKKKRRRWWILGLIVISLAVFCLSPLFPFVRSLAVMRVYSALQERDSLEAETGLWIRMPGGTATPEKDWYPFVMTFNADGSFSRYCGRPSRLTILYNFGAFDYAKGASNLFNEASPYYNSFYGAYMVRQDGRSFGFEAGGEPSAEEIQLAPRFDFFRLVLADFGLKEADGTFEWTITGQTPAETAGLDGWTRIDAQLRVSGVNHVPDGFVTSYLQYGSPQWDCETPFAPVDMQGRVYARYFPEEDVSVFLYVLTADETVLERCDKDILSKTVIDKH